jgi:hypothetical protein
MNRFTNVFCVFQKTWHLQTHLPLPSIILERSALPLREELAGAVQQPCLKLMTSFLGRARETTLILSHRPGEVPLQNPRAANARTGHGMCSFCRVVIRSRAQIALMSWKRANYVTEQYWPRAFPVSAMSGLK